MKNIELFYHLDTLASHRVFNGVQTFLIITKKIDKPVGNIVIYSKARNAIDGHCKIKFIHDWTAIIKRQGIDYLDGYSHRHCLSGAEQYDIIEKAKMVFCVEIIKPCFYAFTITKNMIESQGIKIPRKNCFTYLEQEDLLKLNINIL